MFGDLGWLSFENNTTDCKDEKCNRVFIHKKFQVVKGFFQ